MVCRSGGDLVIGQDSLPKRLKCVCFNWQSTTNTHLWPHTSCGAAFFKRLNYTHQLSYSPPTCQPKEKSCVYFAIKRTLLFLFDAGAKCLTSFQVKLLISIKQKYIRAMRHAKSPAQNKERRMRRSYGAADTKITWNSSGIHLIPPRRIITSQVKPSNLPP